MTKFEQVWGGHGWAPIWVEWLGPGRSQVKIELVYMCGPMEYPSPCRQTEWQTGAIENIIFPHSVASGNNLCIIWIVVSLCFMFMISPYVMGNVFFLVHLTNSLKKETYQSYSQSQGEGGSSTSTGTISSYGAGKYQKPWMRDGLIALFLGRAGKSLPLWIVLLSVSLSKKKLKMKIVKNPSLVLLYCTITMYRERVCSKSQWWIQH